MLAKHGAQLYRPSYLTKENGYLYYCMSALLDCHYQTFTFLKEKDLEGTIFKDTNLEPL